MNQAEDGRGVRILVVQDDPLVVDMVRLTLNHGLFEARAADGVAEGLELVRQWQPQLAIVDMELGGAQLLDEIGRRPDGGTAIPVVGLTRRGDLPTKLEAFRLGVDDIIVCPFSPEELLARVIAVVRRTSRIEIPLRPLLVFGDVEFDILNRRVRVGSSELHLTSLEQSLLYLLAGRGGQVVTREEILDALWGVDYIAESNIVDRHVRNLRAKLQNNWRKPRYIATVPGRGYRFVLQSMGDPST